MSAHVPVALTVVVPLFSPLSCSCTCEPGGALPLMTTVPTLTGSVNSPNGSIVRAGSLLSVTTVRLLRGASVSVGVGTRVGIAAVAVAVAGWVLVIEERGASTVVVNPLPGVAVTKSLGVRVVGACAAI